MKQFSVAPNADASRWLVKLEDVAPEDSFTSKDEAIRAAEELARENQPSRVLILDQQHQLIEERQF